MESEAEKIANRTASQFAQNLASRYGYASVIPLLRPDLRYSQNPPSYVSVGPIITAGLQICN